MINSILDVQKMLCILAWHDVYDYSQILVILFFGKFCQFKIYDLKIFRNYFLIIRKYARKLIGDFNV
jgi:hypothetical protein